uniref:hypothetical protein n=1 Tax=Succinivibrio sp. TaxID=2053619 RepID=UPI00402A8274
MAFLLYAEFLSVTSTEFSTIDLEKTFLKSFTVGLPRLVITDFDRPLRLIAQGTHTCSEEIPRVCVHLPLL